MFDIESGKGSQLPGADGPRPPSAPGLSVPGAPLQAMEVDDVQPAGNQPWRWPAPAVGVGGGVMAVPELAGALAALTQAELAERPAERFLLAHLAALRVAAVVLACRASGGTGRARPRDVWQLLAETAPEYAEWAGFFAASALKREAVRAGAVAMVSAREADDLLRDVGIFHDRVARRLSPAPARREVS